MTEALKVEPEFKAGDVVILNSGSEPMTVDYNDDGIVYCIWWNHERGEPDKAEFSAGVLTQYNG